MRILILTASYLPVLGGLQTATHALACELLQDGHDVLVVADRYPRSLPAQEQIDGVTVRRSLFLKPAVEQLRGRPDLFLAGLYYYPATRSFLTRLLREFRPDVVNMHFPVAQIPFVLSLRKRFRFRLVVSLHGSDVLRWFGAARPFSGVLALDETVRTRPGGKALTAILREADAVTACSRDLLDKTVDLEPSVARKSRAIHNGVDLQRFHDKTRFAHPRPYVFALGRLVYQKGFDLLIEAFAEVAEVYPEVDLIIAGDGEENLELRASVRRLGLDRRVVFAGRVDPAGVVRLLNGCCLLAVPSRWEAFGITALEGLAAGKPVLATRTGGLTEVLAMASSASPRAHGSGAAAVAPAIQAERTLLTEISVDSVRDGLETMLARRAEMEGDAEELEWTKSASWAERARQYLDVYRAAEK